MDSRKKLLRKNTFFIKNGVHLEQVKVLVDVPLWGYDDTYENDKTVSSGYLHYENGMYFLSKNKFDKPVITFKAFKEFILKTGQLEFLEDTVKYYSEDVNRRCISSNGCFYDPIQAGKEGVSDGCAIGRHLKPNLKVDLDNASENIVSEIKVFNQLPLKLKKLGREFLREVQKLHDSSMKSYWDEEGLTDSGKNKVKEIKKEFKL